jgi:cytochrome b subunit of formate dehydrogenase
MEEGKRTAVCTDCHGTHDLRTAQDPASTINRFRLASTCGKCHEKEMQGYSNSSHGRAVALGIGDAPTCTSCHDEHLIKSPRDPTARVKPEHIARELCGDCHTNPELVSKFGVAAGVVESYLDSYHGWAADRRSQLVATCVDCHNVHEIRSPLDPASSVHVENIVATCGRCHERANPTFARSYTHAGALVVRGAHGWAKLVYLVLIGAVLGGMALHNLVIARFEIIRHRRRRRSEPFVVRWDRAERVQHLSLLLSFTGLAVTGFALRFPESWWATLIGLGGNEMLRANLHRAFAVALTTQAVYHTVWMVLTRRGRHALREVRPRGWDIAQVFQNMAFHLGWRSERPAFRRFDYTQKAEYWAVVWGTLIMTLTGFVLWWPEAATSWLPAWSVRVAEVIHFYEAILAVSAIIVWHFFFVIFLPSEYPMSTVWLDGKMPEKEWAEMHRGEVDERNEAPPHPPADADAGGRT